MQDSLKTILYEAIKAKYPHYLTTSEVEAICKGHDKKISNGERRLRKSESPRVLAIKNGKKAIIGYKWIPQKAEIITKPETSKLDQIQIEILNEELDDLEKKYGGPNAWNNAHIIKDIREARKSNDEYRKQSVIRMYG